MCKNVILSDWVVFESFVSEKNITFKIFKEVLKSYSKSIWSAWWRLGYDKYFFKIFDVKKVNGY